MLCAGAIALPPPADWQLVKETDGIVLWSRRTEGHPLFEFRGRTVVPEPIDQVSAVIWDTQHKRDWLTDCAESDVVERPTGPTAIIYNRMKMPAIVADRDVVFQSTVSINAQALWVRFDFRNIIDPRRPPREGIVRMAALEGYLLLRKASATTTEVTYQALVDPGGAIPTFLVNLVLGDVPIQTLRALRKEAALAQQGKYDGSRAEMQRMLQWQGF
jgi:hypothetical protein